MRYISYVITDQISPLCVSYVHLLKGKSEPVNKKLFDIFRQCNFAEESGDGVSVVVSVYGEEAYVFSDNFITVCIPFNKEGYNEQKNTQQNNQETTRNNS